LTRRVAIIGCGNIGGELAAAVDRGVIKARLTSLYDVVRSKCTELAARLSREKPVVAESIEEMLAAKPDIVVEAASQAAVREHGLKILLAGADLMIMSVGALLDEELRSRLEEASRKTGARIHIPSGAIGGLDAVRALRLAGIDKVTLRTRKPPAALKNASGAAGVKLEELRRPEILFRGPASKAVKLFPANVNVAATLTLMSGVEPIVEVIADPTASGNIHEIIIESKASKIKIQVINKPSPANPKTSYLAVLSAVEALRSLASEERIPWA